MHELIGSGGFADVFRATWAEGVRREKAAPLQPLQVAVKQLRSLPREARGLEAFCREIALMQRLQHPNVLAMLARHCGQRNCSISLWCMRRWKLQPGLWCCGVYPVPFWLSFTDRVIQ